MKSFGLKSAVLACLLVVSSGAQAAAPEAHYLDLRDRGLAKFAKPGMDDDAGYKQQEAALKELTAALETLIGPVTIKGLSGKGQSNVDTLYREDSGFGHLDGLWFYSEAAKLDAVVTTPALLKHWLTDHRNDGMPQEIDAALKTDQFYQLAIQDSAFAKYAELPVTKPASASVAMAVLGLRGNGEIKGPPTEIDVLAIQGDRVYFLAARETIKTGTIPACETVYKQMMAKPLNKKDPRADSAREAKAMDAFTACYAKEAPSQNWYANAVKKAQSQLDTLPLR